MIKYDYLVVGAGLFGATFTALAVKDGKKVLVVERRPHIAGNAYTEQIEGVTVHKYGPHIFHTNSAEVFDFVRRFAEFKDFINTPVACYKGEKYHLPFNMNTFSELWGVNSVQQAKQKLKEQTEKYKTENPKNLKEAALSVVGEDIFNKLIKGYSEKQWGRDCEKLPAFIIGRLPLRFEYNNNYFNDVYQCIPVGGYTNMVNEMLKGADVLTDTDYFDFVKQYGTVSKKTVYTGEIDKFFNYKFGALQYRSLKFKTETLNREYVQEVAVVNYTDADTPYTRIIEHKHFLDEKSDKTIISYEYPVAAGSGKEAFYPINDETNNALYKKYLTEAETCTDVLFGGRLGEYKYYDMDKTILRAMEAWKKEKTPTE